MRLLAIVPALLLAAGCSDGGGSSQACADDPFELIEVPASWNASAVHLVRIQWHVIPPENLPVECNPKHGPASGCTVYGPDWTIEGDGWTAIAAADPRQWSETSETGLRRHRTLAHEFMHHPFGSWHD